jgi:hypothetical protein
MDTFVYCKIIVLQHIYQLLFWGWMKERHFSVFKFNLNVLKRVTFPSCKLKIIDICEINKFKKHLKNIKFWMQCETFLNWYRYRYQNKKILKEQKLALYVWSTAMKEMQFFPSVLVYGIFWYIYMSPCPYIFRTPLLLGYFKKYGRNRFFNKYLYDRLPVR